MPKTGLFFSGGKDSAWCIQQWPAPVELITTVGPDGRVPIQGIRREVIEAQASTLGLTCHVAGLPDQCDNATYVETLSGLIRDQRFERLVFGDLHLADVRRFRERSFSGLGVELCFPLWGTDTAALVRDMLAGGLRARICSINRSGEMNRDWLGRELDLALLGEFGGQIDPCGENGEFHTIVEYLPAMSAPVALTPAKTFESAGHLILDFALADRP